MEKFKIVMKVLAAFTAAFVIMYVTRIISGQFGWHPVFLEGLGIFGFLLLFAHMCGMGPRVLLSFFRSTSPSDRLQY